MKGSLEIQTSGTASYGALTGNPTDSTALAAALMARVAKAGDTMTGALAIDAGGAASTPAMHLTGAVFTGGSSTTTKPQLLVEPTGTTSTDWSTGGTLLGANAPSGFGGMLMSLQLNGAKKLAVTSGGALQISNALWLRDGAEQSGETNQAGRLHLGNDGYGVSLSAQGALVSYSYIAAGLGFGSIYHAGRYMIPAAHTHEIRNGTDAQSLTVFNTHTDATNFEGLQSGWSANTAHLWTVKGSAGGAARELHLGHDSTANLKLGAAGAVDFSGLSLTTETISATRTFEIKIGGTTVKVPCVVV